MRNNDVKPHIGIPAEMLSCMTIEVATYYEVIPLDIQRDMLVLGISDQSKIPIDVVKSNLQFILRRSVVLQEVSHELIEKNLNSWIKEKLKEESGNDSYLYCMVKTKDGEVFYTVKESYSDGLLEEMTEKIETMYSQSQINFNVQTGGKNLSATLYVDPNEVAWIQIYKVNVKNDIDNRHTF